MFSRLNWLLRRLFRKIWVRVTAFSALGVATALVALLVKRYIPEDIPAQIGSDAVDSLLTIIATSMLSVTIFSLSTIVSALASATSNITPRATQLLTSDSKAQNALATFLGTFLFSLVGIIGLQTGLYGSTGRVVLYVVTLLMIALIVVTLLRWIDYVLRLGRLGPTSDRVETVATKAMERRRDAPYLGGTPLRDPAQLPADAREVTPTRMGYIQHIDVEAIQAVADKQGLQVFVLPLPGRFVSPAQPLARVQGTAPDSCLDAIRDAFSIGDCRDFDQDPRFGIGVMTEIALRALSPGVNDPGTAIELLSRGTRLLAIWAESGDAGGEAGADGGKPVRCPRVHVPGERIEDLFEDFYSPIARDGAGIVEVGVQLQRMLEVLWRTGDPRYRRAAEAHAAQALERARAVLTLEQDLARLAEAATWAPMR